MRLRRFLRVRGTLWEDGEFEPGIGWETERIARGPHPDPEAVLYLRDAHGRRVSEGPVGLRGRRLTGYLPLNADGRTVVLQHRDREIYRAELAERPPSIAVSAVEVGDDHRVRVSWRAEHEREL